MGMINIINILSYFYLLAYVLTSLLSILAKTFISMSTEFDSELGDTSFKTVFKVFLRQNFNAISNKLSIFSM